MDELNERIAEAKGWRKGYGKDTPYALRPVHYWQALDGRITTVLPNWAGDWDAAGGLLEEMPWPDLYRQDTQQKWICRSADSTVDCYSEGVTAPEAISRAYLAWKESTNVK